MGLISKLKGKKKGKVEDVKEDVGVVTPVVDSVGGGFVEPQKEDVTTPQEQEVEPEVEVAGYTPEVFVGIAPGVFEAEMCNLLLSIRDEIRRLKEDN